MRQEKTKHNVKAKKMSLSTIGIGLFVFLFMLPNGANAAGYLKSAVKTSVASKSAVKKSVASKSAVKKKARVSYYPQSVVSKDAYRRPNYKTIGNPNHDPVPASDSCSCEVFMWTEPERADNIFLTQEDFTIYYQVDCATYVEIDYSYEPEDGSWGVGETQAYPDPAAAGVLTGSRTFHADTSRLGSYTWRIRAANDLNPASSSCEESIDFEIIVIGDIGGSECVGCPDPITDSCEPDDGVWELFDLINAERVNEGLDPLTWHEEAAEVACNWSRRMCNEGFCDHRAPDGTSDAGPLCRPGGIPCPWGGEEGHVSEI